MTFPGTVKALPSLASGSEPDWRIKQLVVSMEHFCFLASCIKIRAITAWAAGRSKNVLDMP